MMVHLHGAEERICDGCERHSVIFDVRGGRAERGLSLCLKCFRDFTAPGWRRPDASKAISRRDLRGSVVKVQQNRARRKVMVCG